MDTTENRIKEIIINRYGSLKKFCELIDMPWTTLDSILKRGFANSNITNVMKISHELKVDTESLASGKIMDCIERFSTEKEEAPKIMQYYEQLNDVGKHEATKRVEEMTHAPQYMKEDTDYLAVKAAHNDAEITDAELEKMERDSALIAEMSKKKR